MKKETLTVETNEHGTTTYCNADGDFHNPDGPAVVHPDGSKYYYINGKPHNPHGPAMVWADGSKAHYINGELLTEAEFKTWQAQQSAPLHNKTATIDGVEYTLIMSFPQTGSVITQTGTDTNLAGLSGLTGVTTQVSGTGSAQHTTY